MPYLLFVDYSLFAVIQKMTTAQRRRFEEHLRKIQVYPGNHANYTQLDKTGILLHVYWIDEADRHIKILRLSEND